MQKGPGIEDFPSLLKKHSLKATPQRLAVHEAMLHLGHASADMVEDYLVRNSPVHITTASVYNILSQLSDLGIYSYCHSTDNKKYFDVNASSHIHMYDRVNHSFREVTDEKLYDAILERIGQRRFKGYRIEKVEIQFVVRPSRQKKGK